MLHKKFYNNFTLLPIFPCRPFFVFFLFDKAFIKLLSLFCVCFVFVLFFFYLYLIIFYFYVIITKQRYNFSFYFIYIMFYFNLRLIKVWFLFSAYKINFLSKIDLYLLLNEHSITFIKAKFCFTLIFVLFYVNFCFTLIFILFYFYKIFGIMTMEV